MIKAAGFRYIPKGAIKVADKNSDAVAYLYQTPSNFPAAKVFYGKQSNPVLNVRFANEAARAKEVGLYFASRQKRSAYKAEQSAKRKAMGRGVEVGQFMASSWGYDQTQVDFYRVEKLIGSTMAEIIKVGSIDVGGEDGGSSMSSKVIPNTFPAKDAKPIRVVVKNGGAKVGGYYASVWDGQPKYVSWYA